MYRILFNFSFVLPTLVIRILFGVRHALKVVDTGGDDAKLQWKVQDADKAYRLAEAVDKQLSNEAFKTIGVSVQVVCC